MLATSLSVAQWLECLTGVRELMGSIAVGDSDFYFVSRLRKKWNIPSFLFLSEFEKYHVCFFINKISVHTKVEIKTTEGYMQQLHVFIFIVLLIF